MIPRQVLYLSYNGILDPVGKSQILPYLKEMTASGFRFHLITFEDPDKLKAHKPETLRKELSEIGIFWRFIRRQKTRNFWIKFIGFTQGFGTAFGILLRARISILHCRAFESACIGWILRKFFWGIDTAIFDMRGFKGHQFAELGRWKDGSVWVRLVNFFEKKLALDFPYTVVHTTEAEALLRSWGRVKPILISPCYVDVKRFRPLTPGEIENYKKEKKLENRKIYIYCGTLIGWYDFDGMLGFFKELASRQPESFLVILSEDDPAGILEKATALNIRNIQCLSLQDDEILKLIACAEAGFTFVRTTFSKKASFAIKTAEYLSCGIPVITTPYTSDIVDLIEDERIGIAVDPAKAIQEEAGRFLKLKDDVSLSKRCREAAISRLSLEVGVSKYLELYEGKL